MEFRFRSNVSYATICFEFIPGLLEDIDKHIEVSDGHYFMEKQKVQVRIKVYNDNRYTLNSALYNVLFAPDLCDRLFSIIC